MRKRKAKGSEKEETVNEGAVPKKTTGAKSDETSPKKRAQVTGEVGITPLSNLNEEAVGTQEWAKSETGSLTKKKNKGVV